MVIITLERFSEEDSFEFTKRCEVKVKINGKVRYERRNLTEERAEECVALLRGLYEALDISVYTEA